MFTELKSLLEKRSLTITVATVHEDQIRVNVIPHSRPEDTKVNEQVTYAHKDEVARIPDTAVKALTTPISLTGTAEEIDSRLASVLLEFVESHKQLQGSFERAIVYLHRGTKEGAAILGFRGKTLHPNDLPAAFSRLTAAEIEDCLCIYRRELAGTLGTLSSCRIARRGCR